VKNRLLWTALLLAGLTVPATAQLTSGATYVLRGASGRYLSAHHDPAQELGFSTNTAGWEQWRYVDYGTSGGGLVSYHGTNLVVATDGSTIAYHAPRHYLDQLAVMRVDVLNTDYGNPVALTFVGPAVVGGKVTLQASRNASTWFVADTGAASPVIKPIGTALIKGVQQPVSTPDEWWTVIAVPAPDMTRAPLQMALGNHDRVELRSYRGFYLGLGTLSNNSFSMILNDAPAPQILDRTTLMSTGDGNGAFPLKFGDPIFIQVENEGYAGLWVLAPGTSSIGLISLPSARGVIGQIAANAWTISDSSGRYHSGDRIPLGAKGFLQYSATGKQLSADPSSPMPSFTGNSGAAEQWAIVKPW
jgi:hypothetical protein